MGTTAIPSIVLEPTLLFNIYINGIVPYIVNKIDLIKMLSKEILKRILILRNGSSSSVSHKILSASDK